MTVPFEMYVLIVFSTVFKTILKSAYSYNVDKQMIEKNVMRYLNKKQRLLPFHTCLLTNIIFFEQRYH